MKRRRVKLVWGAAKVIRGRWYFGLFGLYDRAEGKREDGFAISVRGVLGWSAALMVVGYVAATLALWSFWQRNPYCLLTYGDALFYPVRRAEVAAKKGQAFIAEGQELLKAKNWSDGPRLLKQGLATYPSDLRARLALARFYLMANQRGQATALLSEGLPKEFPGRTYLQSLLDIAEQGEDFDLIVTSCDRYLPGLTTPATAVERRWLTGRKFGALMASQRFGDALALAEAEEPGEMASEHRVLAMVGLGRAAEAVDELARWERRPGADRGTVRRLQVRALREAGRGDEMERALADLRALAPADPRQAVYGIVQRALAGRDEAANAALGDFLFRFGGALENLRMAAEPLAEIGHRALFERCYAAAGERGFALQAFRVLLVQLHLQCGEWAEAAKVLRQIKPAPGRTAPAAEQIWLEWTGLLVEAATLPTEVAQGSLLEFLRGRPWPMTIFRRTIETLRRAGRTETAREVVATAEGPYPQSHWLQEQKVALAQELAAKQPVAASAPAPVSDAAVIERRFFERLDELLRTQQWDAAAVALRDVRGQLPRPDWLELRDGDLRIADLRINHAKGETPAMLASARLYLNGDNVRSERVMAIAREFFKAGDKDAAVALVQAVTQRAPDFAPAARLLGEWKPNPPAEAKKK